ncbi:LPS export ABC transporter periplasmic protein LptC [uncultured Bartonella sp.]|uniref:LPS export ABC transporter periplasmic protein LptC n=1 Tax=uncultured Bartonella sp. TaxID=104108 RepID=UPI00261B5173|nr:LPS export ABC transporter periplasmic protein LptC [uncultured Bartonella sp.]
MNDGSEIFSPSYKSDAVFNAARRHSVRVHLLKFLLPIVAIIIALVFSWFTFFATPSSSDLVVLNGDQGAGGQLTMTDPKLEGYTAANKPYSLKAKKALQDPHNPGMIELQHIVASLPLGERGEATVNAVGAYYDNVNGRLQFDKPFVVKTDDGMVAKLEAADVNLATSQLNTDQPVDIRRGGQHLTANGLQIRENGQVLFFNRGVSLVIDNTNGQ